MIRRNTWILLALFVILLGFLMYYQRSAPTREAKKVTPTAATTYVFPTEETVISGVKVSDQQGRVVALGRDSSGQWALLEPKSSGTDAGAVEQYMSELTTLRVETTLEKPPPPDAVGLITPTYTITVSQNSAAPVIADVGDQTPTGSGYYLQVKGQSSVVIVNKNGLDSFLGILDKPPVPPTPTAAATEPATPTGLTTVEPPAAPTP